jgi:hypothetical protein
MPIPFRFPADFSTGPTVIGGTKTLDGRIYRFRFMPNVRADDGRGAWMLDLRNVKTEPIVLQWKVVLTQDLFAPFRGTVEESPPGHIVVRRTDGLQDDPAIYDLSVPEEPVLLASIGSANVVIEYVTLAEINAAAAATAA